MPSSFVCCFLICSILFPMIACSEEKAEISPPLGDHSCGIFFNTLDAEIVCYNWALVWGLIDGPDHELIVDYGHCWDTLPAPDTADSHTSYGSTYGGDHFSSYLTNLKSATKYYFRMYFINRGVVMYGETLDFTTLSPDDTLRPPECGPVEAVDYSGTIYISLIP